MVSTQVSQDLQDVIHARWASSAMKFSKNNHKIVFLAHSVQAD